jgi:putative transposase
MVSFIDAHHGAHKVWRQLARESFKVARCTVEQLMHSMGLTGVVRGAQVSHNGAHQGAERPLDRANRSFKPVVPMSWGGGLHLRCGCGRFRLCRLRDRCLCPAHLIGWRVARSMRTERMLDALQQAL